MNMQGVSLLLLYVVVNSSFLKIEVAAFQSGKPSTRAASKPCSPARCSTISRVPRCAVGMSGNEEEETAPEGEDSDDSEPIFKKTVRIDDGGSVRIDDGGSDLTDRFKYKVHALMGTYNPQAGTDDERQDGNILNAMLNFPVRYTFNAVGRTGGDEGLRDVYVEEVKKIIIATSGDEDGLECQVTPRGKNFIKIQCAVEVQSSTMITLIYDDLEKLDRTVMRF